MVYDGGSSSSNRQCLEGLWSPARGGLQLEQINCAVSNALFLIAPEYSYHNAESI